MEKITKECGVYKITNIITGDFYIGSADNICYRVYTHKKMLSYGNHHNRHLQYAWNKYGAGAFEFSVVLICDIKSKLYHEQLFLDTLKPSYNIATCAEAPMQGLYASEETKEKMRRSMIGKNKGKFPNNETREKMRNSHLGKSASEEAKLKMSEANKGNTRWLGRKHTEETKKKIGESKKGKPRSEETRRKLSELNTGELHPNYGRFHSEETKERMREAWKSRAPISEETRRKMSEAAKNRNILRE